MKNFINIILGLTLIVGMFVGAFKFLNWVISQIISIDPRISAALITGFLAVVAASLSITIPKYLEKKKEIEEQHRQQKIPAYQSLLNFIFNLLMGSKPGNKPMTEKEIIEFMSKFTQDLILWGSDDVIKSYRNFRLYLINRTPKEEIDNHTYMELLEDLLLSLRKDMGHKNKSLERGELLSLFINDVDKYIEKGKKK
ncbi:hypothetical protein [Cytobacillus gottheilii]|uniref:hypothetical protein n=1 Tax=Cytobacillus gottheilii TaxID=859144 RepID=UPI0009EF3A8A|nr:hypothetical protein [Cytobacillus gottheilii]